MTDFQCRFLIAWLEESIRIVSVEETGDDLYDCEMQTAKETFEEVLELVKDLIAGKIVRECTNET